MCTFIFNLCINTIVEQSYKIFTLSAKKNRILGNLSEIGFIKLFYDKDCKLYLKCSNNRINDEIIGMRAFPPLRVVKLFHTLIYLSKLSGNCIIPALNNAQYGARFSREGVCLLRYSTRSQSSSSWRSGTSLKKPMY